MNCRYFSNKFLTMYHGNYSNELQYNPTQCTVHSSQQVLHQQETKETKDINDIINMFDHSTKLNWKLNSKFLNDIDIIVQELLHYYNYSNIDIYEVLVSCGHNLTWDLEYYITEEDLNWFKGESGKNHFFNKINEKRTINTIEDYTALFNIHNTLVELFELQVQ